MTYTTTQIREFCDAFDRGELEYSEDYGTSDSYSHKRWLKVNKEQDIIDIMHECALLRITPKPTPPVYEQWTDIKEVPLGDWYRLKISGEEFRVVGIGINHILLGREFYTLETMFNHFLHSPDPFAPDSEWMICGREKR